jgi:hypothetical protein
MGLAIALMVPLLPGLATYVIFSGDVHFSDANTGIAVIAIVSWMFWTAITYAIMSRRERRRI